MYSYLDPNFDVLHAADNTRYAESNDLGLVNLSSVGLFSIYILTTTSGKHLENRTHSLVVSSLYRRMTSAKGADDLSVRLDPGHGKRQQQLTNKKSVKGKYRVGRMLRHVFGFSKHQEKATHGLGNKLINNKE